MVKKLALLFIVWRILSALPSEIWIIHINDIHGALAPSEAYWMNPDFPPPLGGGAGAITTINEIRAEAQRRGIPTITVDLGDWFSGTPLGDFSRGRTVIDFLNTIDIDASVIGNHDFSFGLDTLKALIKMLKAPVLCANLIEKSTGQVPDFLTPYMVLEFDSLRVGLFGLITHYLTGMVAPEHMPGLEVLKHYVGAERSIKALKAQSADIIIGLTHSGFSHDRRLADSVPGIDVIIGGHSHSGIEPPFETPRYHTIIVQAYSRLSAVGLLKLKIEKATKKIKGYEGEIITLYGEAIPLNKEYLTKLINWQKEVEKDFDEVIGISKRELVRSAFSESPIGNLITDAMREFAQADIAVTNSGGIRANLPQGEITYRDLYKIETFGNTAVIMTMTGRQIWEMLEVSVIGYHAIFQVSGLKMVYNPHAPPKQRLIAVEINNKPIDFNKEYKVVTNNFLAAGGGAYSIFKEAKDVEDTYKLIRDILADYIKKHSPIDYKIEGRIVAKTP
ncbi:MAG: 5'-nucleotidase C-terminal domain-containing protein [candidate division WOR-3 bacterium]|nr:5'-nucleotidase C-terminal domain-containing protein [candidate division WOR-3 bacterium]MCX7757249.1 5'-nucleotidase C-terminal domain-containing protein [candidate division WOR-3 bacterium]MDW7987593.1 5'-nucleotidase C-terminal domain-containing protein [candidate division WOR-3 bacterium]